MDNLSPSTISSPSSSEARDGEPGSKLQRAREERRWTRADIAAMLHLNINVVTALEENNYSALPFPTFIRGYIRSYANLLELPSEPLLSAYERRGFNPPPPIAVRAQSSSSTDKMWYFFSYIVALGLIVLVILWWRSDPIEQENTVLTQLPPSPDNPLHLGPTMPGDKTHDTSRELADILAVGPPPEDSTPPPPSPAAETPLPHPAPTPPQPTVNQIVPSPESAPIPAPPPPPPTDNKPTITIHTTTHNSWVKITDGQNHVILNREISAGQTQTIQGTAPFKLNLSRVEGLNLEYNGQPFDFQKYIKRGKARFTLGKTP